MLGTLIDAGVLIFLLQMITDDDVGIGTAIIIALGAAIGTNLLATLLIPPLGFVGIFAAVVVAAALLGVVLSALFGTELKRSVMIGGIFSFVHVCVSVGLYLMSRS